MCASKEGKFRLSHSFSIMFTVSQSCSLFSGASLSFPFKTKHFHAVGEEENVHPNLTSFNGPSPEEFQQWLVARFVPGDQSTEKLSAGELTCGLGLCWGVCWDVGSVQKCCV